MLESFLKRLLFFLFLLIFSVNANDKIDEFKLKNGLKVIMIQRKSVPIISLSIWFKCGSKCDPLSKSGAAHFLEHLAFLNHKQVFSDYLEEIGADKNAFTSINAICFYEIFPKDCLEKVLSFESQRLGSLVIDDKAFQNEKKSILEERVLTVDGSTGGQLRESFLANAFNRQIGGIDVIGWKHEISSITKDDLVSFYKKWLVPNNAFIIMVGDFEKESAQKMLKKYFENIPSADLPKLTYFEDQNPTEKLIQFKSVKMNPSAYVRYLYKLPFLSKNNLRKAIALDLALEVLRQPSLFIHGILKQMSNLVASFSFLYLENFYQYDCLIASFGVSSIDKLDQVEASWNYFKKRIAKGCVTEADLNKIKRKKLIALAYKKEDIKYISDYFGTLLISGLSTKDILSLDDTIQDITVQECNDVLKEVFSLSPAYTFKALPRGYDRD